MSYISKIKEVISARQGNYAPPHKNHQVTADLLSAWLSARLGMDIRLSPEDVCMINVLQKSSRLANGTHDDSWIDIVGYSENVSMLKEEQRN